MRASQFNLITKYDATGELLVFNTASGALVALSGQLGQEMEMFSDGTLHAADLSPELLAVLVEHGFAISGEEDEVAKVIQRNGLGIVDPNRLDVFLLPNMNCNFACPYCYESHYASRIDAEVERRILAWFEQMVPRFKVVLLSWFGGEPLLSYQTVLRLQQAVREICDRAAVGFNSHITTNGYLLNAERAAELCAAELLSYQITMDGPPDIHNERRLLKGAGDSFERIFANICDLAAYEPRANIKLRVNFDATTIGRIPELLERFPVEIRGRLHPVLERLFDQAHLFIGKSPEWIAQQTEIVYNTARQLGFAVTTTPLNPEKLTYCYADRASQFLFNHRGDVFKCTVSGFTSEERLGYLDEGGQIVWEGDRHRDWMDVPALDDDCHRCTYLPMCMGGCRKNRSETGHASADCTLPFAALDERVRQRYTTELASR